MIAAIAAWFAGSRIAAALGAVAGWFFADWRRILALLIVAALVGTYLIADERRGRADAIVLQQRLDAQSKAFITAADTAMTKEHNRQVQAGKDVTAAFDKQMAARDVADAKNTQQMEAQIAAYQSKLAALGRHYGLSADDLRMLDAQP